MNENYCSVIIIYYCYLLSSTGYLTPTLKLKRYDLRTKYEKDIEQLFMELGERKK
jgi:hypothetical protein